MGLSAGFPCPVFDRSQNQLTRRHEATKEGLYSETPPLVMLAALCENNSLCRNGLCRPSEMIWEWFFSCRELPVQISNCELSTDNRQLTRLSLLFTLLVRIPAEEGPHPVRPRKWTAYPEFPRASGANANGERRRRENATCHRQVPQGPETTERQPSRSMQSRSACPYSASP